MLYEKMLTVSGASVKFINGTYKKCTDDDEDTVDSKWTMRLNDKKIIRIYREKNNWLMSVGKGTLFVGVPIEPGADPIMSKWHSQVGLLASHNVYKDVQFIDRLPGAPNPNTVDVIVSSYNEPDELLLTVESVSNIYKEFNIRIFVYEKGVVDPGTEQKVRMNTLENVDVSFHALPNLGREFHTYTYHVSKYYDDLSDVLVFTTGNTTKHRRRERLFVEAGDISKMSFACLVYSETHGDHMEWVHPRSYEGRILDLANPRGLYRWAMEHIGIYSEPYIRNSARGIFITTRERVRTNRRSTFKRVFENLSADEPEAGHYCERLVYELFGGAV